MGWYEAHRWCWKTGARARAGSQADVRLSHFKIKIPNPASFSSCFWTASNETPKSAETARP